MWGILRGTRGPYGYQWYLEVLSVRTYGRVRGTMAILVASAPPIDCSSSAIRLSGGALGAPKDNTRSLGRCCSSWAEGTRRSCEGSSCGKKKSATAATYQPHDYTTMVVPWYHIPVVRHHIWYRPPAAFFTQCPPPVSCTSNTLSQHHCIGGLGHAPGRSLLRHAADAQHHVLLPPRASDHQPNGQAP
jgi:hypothetical protein